MWEEREARSPPLLLKMVILNMNGGTVTWLWTSSQVRKVPVALGLNISRIRVKIARLRNFGWLSQTQTSDAGTPTGTNALAPGLLELERGPS